MPDVGERLLRWWKSASTQARWVAGIVLFSLICTAALMLIADSVAVSGAAGTSSAVADPSPLFYLDAVLKLLFVIGLFIGGAILTRHFSGKKIFNDPSRQLELLETLRLSPRQALHLVRVGERSLLIGATDQSFSLLADMGQQKKIEEFSPAPEVSETFQVILESAAQKAL
jgi:flagellar biosynthetic protein FliO